MEGNVLIRIISNNGLLSLPTRRDILVKSIFADKVVILIDFDEQPSESGLRALSFFISQIEEFWKEWEIWADGRVFYFLSEIADHFAELGP